MTPMNRHFFITCRATGLNLDKIMNVMIVTKGNLYLQHKALVELIISKVSVECQVVITNVIEMDALEYEEFISED